MVQQSLVDERRELLLSEKMGNMIPTTVNSNKDYMSFKCIEDDMSFRCIECGADNEDIKVTNGRVISSFRCQTCRTDVTKGKSRDLRIFCDHGCESVTSYENTAFVINQFRQVH